MKKKRRTGHSSTQLSSMVENISILYVYRSKPTPCNVNLTQREGANSWACIPSGEPGLHHQLPKIHSRTFKEDRISWFLGDSTTMEIKLPFYACQTNSGMHRTTGLVGETPDQMERVMFDLTKTITSDRDRCINHRLGSYMQGSPNRGTLVRDRESLAHKLPRTSSSNIAVKCFARDKENIMILLRMDNTTAI